MPEKEPKIPEKILVQSAREKKKEKEMAKEARALLEKKEKVGEEGLSEVDQEKIAEILGFIHGEEELEEKPAISILRPEEIPDKEEARATIKEKINSPFSYWSLFNTNYPGAVVDHILGVAKRKKALKELKESGFESFEDLEINNISVNRIEKLSSAEAKSWLKNVRQYYIDAFGHKVYEQAEVEKIFGEIKLTNPLFGLKPVSLEWKAYVYQTSKNVDTKEYQTALYWYEKDYPPVSAHDVDIEVPRQVEKRAKENGLNDFVMIRGGRYASFYRRVETSSGIYEQVPVQKKITLAKAYFMEVTEKVFAELNKYIKTNCVPEQAINPDYQKLAFNVSTEISQKIDKERDQEIIEGLRKREFDEKIFYLGAGAEKYLEYLKSDENKLNNFELQLMKKSSDKLAPFINKRIIHDLGPANALKIIPLLEKQLETQEEVEYVPIDINPAMIFAAAANINNPKIKVEGKILDFTKPMAGKLEAGSKFFTLLGNTLGNGDENYQKGLLKNINQAMTADDYLMVGIHLKSDWQEIIKSYESDKGREVFLTAVENIGFPLAKIDLEIIADQKNRQIKAMVKIKEDLQVKGVEFKQGENLTIFVSQKYEVGELAKLAQSAGLEVEKTFLDEKNQYELAVLRKGK